MPLSGFHPAVARWFEARFREPTEPQRRAWPVIQSGDDALIAAPTGSGKTFAAFLAAIDALLRQGLDGALRDEIQVLYVSPLKALSNDVQKNLSEPLAEIRAALAGSGLPEVEIRTLVRTGDTPASERPTVRDHRLGPRSAARSRDRDPVLAARGGDGGRGMGRAVRTARAAHRGASHHAGIRQHAAARRARDAAPVRAPRRGAGDVA